MLQTFRPHQTVLESGIGTGCASGSTSRNKSVQRVAAGKEVLAGEAMRAFRKVTRFSLERNKRALSEVDTKNTATEEEGVEGDSNSDGDRDQEQDCGNDDEFSVGENGMADEFDEDIDDSSKNIIQGKNGSHAPRLSKAARRKQKTGMSQDPMAHGVFLSSTVVGHGADASGGHAESSYGSENRFHDSRHFMTYGTEDDKADFMESAMQPLSGMRGAELQGS
jgi:hypothetical protein